MIECMKSRDGYFPVTCLNREDIVDLSNLRIREDLQKKIRAIPDKDMYRIAEDMADAYLENFYWESLEIIMKEYIKEKGW